MRENEYSSDRMRKASSGMRMPNSNYNQGNGRSQGNRRTSGNPNGARPQGQRNQGQRPQGSRSQSQRPQGSSMQNRQKAQHRAYQDQMAATSSQRTRDYSKAGRDYGRKKKRKNKKLMGVLGVEIIILGILFICFLVNYANNQLNKINTNDLNEEELYINEGLSTITKSEYTTLALFGLDSRDISNDTRDRSDCIIIVSINNKTKEVRMASVYRDTYLELANPEGNHDGEFTKITHAYAYGGAKASVATLNKNLDLQITDYVTVNFASMANVVDALGGITVNVDEAERESVNIWLPETAEIAGRTYTPLYETGDVTLDGLQAVTYCRIRNIGNGDIDRAGRQREVLGAILDKAKTSNLRTLNKILDSVLPQISTSLDKKEIVALMSCVFEYEITTTEGFPFAYHMGSQYDQTVGQSLYMDTPAGLVFNTELLHKYLYDAVIDSDYDYRATEEVDENGNVIYSTTEALDESKKYSTSTQVNRINDAIINNTGIYPPQDPEFRGGFQ